MQNVTEAVQDELVKSLDYKLGSSNVNYIQSRKDVQYFPSSLSTFTPTTSRVARIPLISGMDFIDPESVKIAFRVRNNSTTLGLNPARRSPRASSSGYSSSQMVNVVMTYRSTGAAASCTHCSSLQSGTGTKASRASGRSAARRRPSLRSAHRDVPGGQVFASSAQFGARARVCRGC